MKLNKYILGVGLLAATLFSSCDTDNLTEIYEDSKMGITFTFESQEVSFPAHGYEGFDVEVVRSKGIDKPLEYPITVSLLDNKGQTLPLPAEFTAPSVASFKAGEFKTMIHISVGNIKSGRVFKLAIDLDKKETSIDATTRKIASVYRDYTYSRMGIGTIVSNFYADESGTPAEGETEIYRADDIHWYKAIAPYEDGKDIVFKVNSKNQVLVEKQPAASHPNYGIVFAEGMGTFKDGVIKVQLEFTVSAGSFGQYVETITLPTQE